MSNVTKLVSLLAFAGAVQAENVSETDRLLCSQNQVLVCVHSVECASVTPAQVGMPQFVILDLDKKRISTTRASSEVRRSDIANLSREGGLIVAQGREGERVFSLVIDEATGTLTGSTATDGYTISSFGECTDAEVEAG